MKQFKQTLEVIAAHRELSQLVMNEQRLIVLRNQAPSCDSQPRPPTSTFMAKNLILKDGKLNPARTF